MINVVDSNKQYFYYINYKDNQKDLCELEMKAIFGFIPDNKLFVTTIVIDPSRSVFIKYRIEVNYQENSLESLESKVLSDQLYMDDYKIIYLKNDFDITYEERLNAMRKIGFAIEGKFSLANPKVELALTKINGSWILGYYKKNDNSWVNRKQKPHNYSFALDVWLAKALINIAVENNFTKKIVDPCCGIGTVLIEGYSIGANIKGYDINPTVVNQTKQNLKFFGFNANVECKNISDIDKYYDVAIIDLPYGKFIKSHSNNRNDVIKISRNISKRVIFISMTNINEIVRKYGFSVTNTCKLEKRSKFSRFITLCE
ncbi:SAM-dependent methyltransferase [Mycoplasmatota bacterium zrk1]